MGDILRRAHVISRSRFVPDDRTLRPGIVFNSPVESSHGAPRPRGIGANVYELRGIHVLPSEERRVASILQRMGQSLVDAGVRNPFHVSFSGGTTPGDKQLVRMTWTSEKIESTFPGGRETPAEDTAMMTLRNELTADTWVELNELMNDDKMLDA